LAVQFDGRLSDGVSPDVDNERCGVRSCAELLCEALANVERERGLAAELDLAWRRAGVVLVGGAEGVALLVLLGDGRVLATSVRDERERRPFAASVLVDKDTLDAFFAELLVVPRAFRRNRDPGPDEVRAALVEREHDLRAPIRDRIGGRRRERRHVRPPRP